VVNTTQESKWGIVRRGYLTVAGGGGSDTLNRRAGSVKEEIKSEAMHFQTSVKCIRRRDGVQQERKTASFLLAFL